MIYYIGLIAEVRDCSCFVRLLIWRTCADMRCGSTSALDPSVHGQMLGGTRKSEWKPHYNHGDFNQGLSW